MPEESWVQRLMGRVFGPEYGYRMRYSAGTVGLLTILERVRWLGRQELPTLNMLFAYRPIRFGETLVQPIYVTRRRPGLAGAMLDRFLLFLTACAFHRLKEEDGRLYDNMRFNPVSLLEIDRPIEVFIDKINGLTPSCWSRMKSQGEGANGSRSDGDGAQPGWERPSDPSLRVSTGGRLMKGRSMHAWLADYGRSHRHRVNRICHFFGIPSITISLVLALVALRHPGVWPWAGGLFALGWTLQFVGHAFEGKPPEFLRDWRFLFVGFRWWLREVWRGFRRSC